jgi:acyl-CoA reductase-like NAD-dependent aldehyde dehydrogenase
MTPHADYPPAKGRQMTIAGALASGTSTFGVIDPSTGQVIDNAPACGREQVEQVMAALQSAATEWAANPDRRKACLRAAAGMVDGHAEELAALVCRELGAPPAQALSQAAGLANFFRFYAEMVELEAEILSDAPDTRVAVLRRPVGPVVAIAPWNGPLYMAAMKIAPALAAGDPVVLKPSPYTPLATLRAGELLVDVFPPGVFNVVSGDNDLGPLLTSHRVPRMVTFTGSVATGLHVAAAAAADLKRVTLELGGNDAAVLLDDIDVEETAQELFRAGFHNCGQVCVAPKRVFVHDSRYDDLVEALADRARTAVVGSPGEEGVELGPVQNASQLARIIALVDDARTRGARVATGGIRMDRPGYFFQPTIIAEAVEGMRVVDEEQFGPVMPVIRFSDVDDAVSRANATEYGLGASAWSSDPVRAEQVADRLVAGQAWVNTHQSTLGPHQPVVGVKTQRSWRGEGALGTG